MRPESDMVVVGQIRRLEIGGGSKLDVNEGRFSIISYLNFTMFTKKFKFIDM